MTPETKTSARPQGGVQVPGIIAEFLNHATVAAAGTRDANHVPHVHRVSAWRLEPDRETMACMVPEMYTKGLLESLEENGQIALTIEEIGPHETYQFKGMFAGAAPCTAADLQVFERVRERFGNVLAMIYGYPEAACRAHIVKPALTVRFRVQEIFVQTPGPAAGRRLVPPEER